MPPSRPTPSCFLGYPSAARARAGTRTHVWGGNFWPVNASYRYLAPQKQKFQKRTWHSQSARKWKKPDGCCFALHLQSAESIKKKNAFSWSRCRRARVPLPTRESSLVRMKDDVGGEGGWRFKNSHGGSQRRRAWTEQASLSLSYHSGCFPDVCRGSLRRTRKHSQQQLHAPTPPGTRGSAPLHSLLQKSKEPLGSFFHWVNTAVRVMINKQRTVCYSAHLWVVELPKAMDTLEDFQILTHFQTWDREAAYLRAWADSQSSQTCYLW